MHLIVTSPVHVARHGTFVTTPGLAAALAAGYATVHVTTDVANDGTAAAQVQVVTTVRDAASRPAGQAAATVSVPPGQTQQASTVSTATAAASANAGRQRWLGHRQPETC